MKKINLKLFLSLTLILVGLFSVFLISDIEVLAQTAENNNIQVETTGYSVLSSSFFVFAGYYSGNFDKEGFTTYFEFKKDDSDLNDSKDREKTIVIKRFPNADEYGYFYTSPELKLFSDYYFRAVGCFEESFDKNDDCSKHDSIKKYYGEIFHLRTGYIPFGSKYPFTINRYNKVVDYVPPICKLTEELLAGVCKEKTPPTCTSSEELKDGVCVAKTPTTPTTPPTTTSNTNYNLPSFEGGLVPCDGSAEHPCEFPQLIQLLNTVISFIFTNLILPLAAIMFAYAGFELVTSGGSTEKKSKAKSIFINVATGLVISLAAFVIIKTILLILGARTDLGINWFGFFDK